MKLKSVLGSMCFAIALGLISPAQAAVTLFTHDNSTTTSGSAVCLAAPNRDTGAIVVTRIRITSSRATATTYTFSYMRTSDALFDTEDLSSCALPSCSPVMSIEGVQNGRVTDVKGLSLLLPPGTRLYGHTDSVMGTDHQTIEVFYRQQ